MKLKRIHCKRHILKKIQFFPCLYKRLCQIVFFFIENNVEIKNVSNQTAKRQIVMIHRMKKSKKLIIGKHLTKREKKSKRLNNHIFLLNV